MTHTRITAGLLAGLWLILGCGCSRISDTSVPEFSTPVEATTSNTATTTAAATITTTTTTATVTATTTATTAAPVLSDREQVIALLSSGRVADIYRTSWDSIFGRLQTDGFFQESLTGRYKGEYIRSIGALAILAVETGETAVAGKALKFVTDTMTQKNLSHLPFTLTADGTVRQEDELDGRAHFVLGWAQYIAATKDSAYFADSYQLMKREADAFCSDAYFNTTLGLMGNPRLTHTRMRNGSDYHNAYDLLTNSFVLAALEELAAVADSYGKSADGALWRDTAAALRTGLTQNLTRTADGRTVFRELLYHDGGQYTPEDGVSWICLTPFADCIDPDIWENTVSYTRQRLWKTAAKGGYLTVECAADGTVKNRILGKSVGWDLAAAAQEQDFAHAVSSLKFLENYHTSSIYMEWMVPSGNSWKLIDCGNGEQAIWFLWGMARLRQSVGLSAKV